MPWDPVEALNITWLNVPIRPIQFYMFHRKITKLQQCQLGGHTLNIYDGWCDPLRTECMRLNFAASSAGIEYKNVVVTSSFVFVSGSNFRKGGINPPSPCLYALILRSDDSTSDPLLEFSLYTISEAKWQAAISLTGYTETEVLITS